MQLLFYAFLGVTFIQLCYYLGVFSTFSFSKLQKPKENNQDMPVSVIICARNEAQNLQEHLPYFVNQEYKNFELVLINDGSSDETLEIMEQFKTQYPDIISIIDVVPNEQFWRNKKYALTLGIKAAKHELLLFSDADCKPVSTSWITQITTHLSAEKEIILGYGAYEKIENSWLNKLIRFETLFTAIQYFSYAKIGLPYMGVGRNLAYKKALFFKSNGFAKHMHIRSGDDDLFVSENATNQNVVLAYFSNSFTVSKAKKTFNEWVHQKRRHTTTSSFYKPIHKFLLGLFYVSQLLFWSLGIILLSTTFQWKIVLPIFLIRIIIFSLMIKSSAKKLNEKDLIVYAPFLELFLIFSQLFIFMKNIIKKPTHW